MSQAYVTMSAKEAEELNRELSRASGKNGTFMFIPVNSATSAPARGTTPKIWIDQTGALKSGGASGRPNQGGQQRRKSLPVAGCADGPSTAGRKRAMSMGGASQGEASLAPPNAGQQRSKRPKLQAQSSRASMGSSETAAVQAAMKPCYKLLKDLLRNPLVYPFAKPVDPVLYPDYYTVITDPIDLGTIKKRLEGGEFESPEEFATEVRRVWSNCFVYNPEGSDVSRMASQLSAIFEQKFRDMPAPAESNAAEEEMKAMRKQMRMMQKQMLMMQQMQHTTLSAAQTSQMMGMGMGVSMGMMGMGMGPPRPTPQKRSGGSSKKSQGRGQRSSSQFAMLPLQQHPLPPTYEDSRDMTFEEKSALSASINKLTSNNLGKVVQIIRTSMPSLGAGSDEIEVDINALDNVTLWKLHTFVESCKASKKKASKKPAQVTASSRLQAIQQAQAGAEQQLSEITAGLRSLEEAGSGGVAGGITLSRQETVDDESPSDSDSDGGGGLGLLPSASKASGNGGGTSSAFYEDFKNAKMQREREREDAQRRQQEAATAAQERARQQAAEHAAAIERQRAAERARREAEMGGIDLLGQSSAMASFENNEDLFGLDPYGSF